MIPVLRNMDLRDINAIIEDLHGRLDVLERKSSVILPMSAPRSPVVGQAWMDVESGKINVWDGNSVTTYSKD